LREKRKEIWGKEGTRRTIGTKELEEVKDKKNQWEQWNGGVRRMGEEEDGSENDVICGHSCTSRVEA